MIMARPALLHRNTMRRLALLAGAGLIGFAIVALADTLLDFHGAFRFDGRLIFYAAFGWLVGLVVIGLAKALGAVLKRPANYYDKLGG
jgi:hypothetical protein